MYPTDERKRRLEIAAVATVLVLAVVVALFMVSRQRGTRGSAATGTTRPSVSAVSPTPTPAVSTPTPEQSPTSGSTENSGDDNGGSGDNAGGGGDDGDDGQGPAVEEIVSSPKDCLSYDPEALTVKSLGATGWALADSDGNLASFDTQADASNAKAVARNYTKQCFIGRDNDRSMRHRYITTYWEAPSGLPFGLAPALDCEPSYDPASMEFHNAGTKGWRLVAAGELMPLYFDTLGDAARGREVAMDHSQLCFVGRGNDRPEPYKYIHEFWQG